MGETGPCGPVLGRSSTITARIAGGPPGYARGGGRPLHRDLEPGVHAVRTATSGHAAPAARPSIDTGMGLERIAAVLQGVHDNYDIDLFHDLIKAPARDLTHVAKDLASASLKVIADHICAPAFLIADGVLPGNEGRGYVLRRIMRRAMRHAELLGAKEPLMWKLVPTLTREMGQAFPELLRAEALIGETLKLEETRFRATLERGLAILDEKSRSLKKATCSTATRLHALRHVWLSFRSHAGCVARARHRGRHRFLQRRHGAPGAKGARLLVGLGRADGEAVWFGCGRRSGATEFLGYETESAEGVVSALVRDGKEVAELEERRGRRGGDEPDAVLRRERWPGRRCRRDAPRGRASHRHRHAEEGRRSVRACCECRAGRGEGRRSAAA